MCENLCCHPHADPTECRLSMSTGTSEFPRETCYLLFHGNSGSFCFLCLETQTRPHLVQAEHPHSAATAMSTEGRC